MLMNADKKGQFGSVMPVLGKIAHSGIVGLVLRMRTIITRIRKGKQEMASAPAFGPQFATRLGVLSHLKKLKEI
jgi:hypothetical protein